MRTTLGFSFDLLPKMLRDASEKTAFAIANSFVSRRSTPSPAYLTRQLGFPFLPSLQLAPSRYYFCYYPSTLQNHLSQHATHLECTPMAMSQEGTVAARAGIAKAIGKTAVCG